MSLIESPFGLQIKTRLSGFPAIVITLITAFVVIFVLICQFPEGRFKTTILVFCIAMLVILTGLSCFIGITKPNLFSVKEEHHIIIEHRRIKRIEEEPRHIASKLKPLTTPQMEKLTKEQEGLE